jgi:gliding motility-associated protein GldC
MNKEAEIRLNVKLDENNYPTKILWESTDGSTDGLKDTKSFILSLWDEEEKSTLGIDLWTQEMLVDNMKIFYYQTFMRMADTFQRATNNKEAADMIKDFADNFAEKLNSEGQK